MCAGSTHAHGERYRPPSRRSQMIQTTPTTGRKWKRVKAQCYKASMVRSLLFASYTRKCENRDEMGHSYIHIYISVQQSNYRPLTVLESRTAVCISGGVIHQSDGTLFGNGEVIILTVRHRFHELYKFTGQN